MLKNLWVRVSAHSRVFLVLAFILLAASALFSSLTLTPSYRKCDSNNQGHNGNQGETEFFQKTGTLFTCEGVALDANAALLTALATIIMAVFTATLWHTSRRQGELAEESLRRIDREFIATHRPRLAIREPFIEATILNGEDGQLVDVVYLLENYGDSPAHIVASSLQVSFWAVGGLPGLPALGEMNRDVGDISLEAGQDRRLTAKTQVKFEKRFIIGNLSGQTCFYFLGRIRFREDLGIERQIAFCRQFNSKSLRFHAIPNCEDEYGG